MSNNNYDDNCYSSNNNISKYSEHGLARLNLKAFYVLRSSSPTHISGTHFKKNRCWTDTGTGRFPTQRVILLAALLPCAIIRSQREMFCVIISRFDKQELKPVPLHPSPFLLNVFSRSKANKNVPYIQTETCDAGQGMLRIDGGRYIYFVCVCVVVYML